MARILSIDDDPDLQEIMAMALRARSHEVHHAFNGEEGCEKARAVSPDLIILDMMLPTLNGLEVLKILKDDPELQRIPVIVLSAFYGEGPFTERAMKELGAKEFLQKPVRLEDLSALIDCALKARSTSAR